MEKIHILLSADDKYAQWCGVTVYSITQTTHTPVQIYIASHKISSNNKKRLLSLSSELVDISIFEIDETLFNNCIVTDRIPISSYVRLFAASLLPNVSKLVYLDCDVLVQSDLSQLWRTNLEGYPLAGIRDCNSAVVNHSLGFSDGFYINAGILLMNLDFMRSHDVQDKFLQTIDTKKNLIRFHDQDVINLTLHNQILELPTKYNSAKKRHKNDVIIHFIWDKPWDFSDVDNTHNIDKDRFFAQYWKIFRKTPWHFLWNRYRKQYYLYRLKKFYEKICAQVWTRQKSRKNKKYKLFGITIIKKIYKKDRVLICFFGVPLFFYVKMR